MKTLAPNQIQEVPRAGSYAIVVAVTSGTVTLEMSIYDSEFKPINDASFATDFVGIIDLPRCQVRAVIDGDGEVFIKLQERAL